MDGKVITDLKDMTYLSWSKIRNSSGTAGSFLKAYDDTEGVKKYFKLSNYSVGEGIVGHESVNEIIVDRLLSILGIPHLNYTLVHAKIIVDNRNYETYVCESEDFKKKGESKIALDAYFQTERRQNEDLMNFCIRNGWEEYIYQMLVVDFLILNRDRHGANIEVLRNKKNKTTRLAPLFDHGLSLVFSSLSEESLIKFDVMKDLRVQCCVGSGSTLENLKLIPKDKMTRLNALKENDRSILMEDLDGIMPALWQDKIWEMIWKRWNLYEDICNQR